MSLFRTSLSLYISSLYLAAQEQKKGNQTSKPSLLHIQLFHRPRTEELLLNFAQQSLVSYTSLASISLHSLRKPLPFIAVAFFAVVSSDHPVIHYATRALSWWSLYAH
ncbi:RNA methyltransferase [Sesbania bispinosa]|nr:RNA methyltransferase [Sesbania bispinosa]